MKQTYYFPRLIQAWGKNEGIRLFEMLNQLKPSAMSTHDSRKKEYGFMRGRLKWTRIAIWQHITRVNVCERVEHKKRRHMIRSSQKIQFFQKSLCKMTNEN
jgi:hypothetical protein